MIENIHIDLRISQDDQVTVATIEFPGFEHLIGSAKRHPKDPHVPVVGQWFALQRLFQQVADHYQNICQNYKIVDVDHSQPEEQPSQDDYWDELGVPPSERLD